MSKAILCAVDLTHADDAKQIIAEAGRLAEMNDATLSVVTVLPDYNMSWVGSFFQDGTLKEAAAAADQALHALVRDTLPSRDQVQHIVEIGTAYERVLATIPTCSADLVVVGAHRPDFADKVMGPNAARIVRHAPVSVYVVRL